MIFLPRLIFKKRLVRSQMVFLLFTNTIVITSLHQFSVFNAQDPVRCLSDLFIMSDHHHGLVKLLAGDPQQTQHILAGPAVQVPCGLC